MKIQIILISKRTENRRMNFNGLDIFKIIEVISGMGEIHSE